METKMKNMSLDHPRSTLFYNFLDDYIDNAREDISKDYFHLIVVAEAFSQGFKDGDSNNKKTFREDLIEKRIESYKQRYLQAYILAKKVLAELALINTSARGLFINVHEDNPKVLISVPDDLLLDDFWVEAAYKAAFNSQDIFKSAFSNSNLDISLVSSENLDVGLLRADGYDYFEEIN